MDLGKTIKLLRISAGMKQKDLADRLGVTSNYLSMIENNRREPSISFLREMADALGVPLGLLFLEIDESKHMGAPESHELLARIRDLVLEIERLRLREQATERNE